MTTGQQKTSPTRMILMILSRLPCTGLARVATCRSASGCSRWARLETSPRRTIVVPLRCRLLAGVATCRSVSGWSRWARPETSTKTNNHGVTPMHGACYSGHLSVCQWLVLNSALNDPTSEQVDEAIVQGAARRMSNHTQSKLLSWARDMIDTHDTFLNVFLRALSFYC